MDLRKIREVADHQRVHRQQTDGKMVAYDTFEAKATFEDKAGLHLDVTMGDHADDQLLEKLGLKGTVNDFVKVPDKKNFKPGELEALQTNAKEVINFAVLKRMTERPLTYRVIWDDSDQTAKAVMSTRYQRIPNADVIDSAVEVFGEEIDEHTSSIDENYLSLNFMPKKENDRPVVKGDVVGFGGRMYNSETGESSLGLSAFIYRYICGNGAMASTAVDFASKTHTFSELRNWFDTERNSIVHPDSSIIPLQRAATRPLVISTPEEIPEYLKSIKIPLRHHIGIQHAYGREPIVIDNGEIRIATEWINEENRKDMQLNDHWANNKTHVRKDDPNLGINNWALFNAGTNYLTHDYAATTEYNAREAVDITKQLYALLLH
jgi:hypothetical protein